MITKSKKNHKVGVLVPKFGSLHGQWSKNLILNIYLINLINKKKIDSNNHNPFFWFFLFIILMLNSSTNNVKKKLKQELRNLSSHNEIKNIALRMLFQYISQPLGRRMRGPIDKHLSFFRFFINFKLIQMIRLIYRLIFRNIIIFFWVSTWTAEQKFNIKYLLSKLKNTIKIFPLFYFIFQNNQETNLQGFQLYRLLRTNNNSKEKIQEQFNRLNNAFPLTPLEQKIKKQSIEKSNFEKNNVIDKINNE